MIVGPSGCGKTTLLNAIAGFHSINSGSITLTAKRSADPAGRPPISTDRIVVFQNGALFPWKTNLDNVAFGPIVQETLGREEAYEKARALMADAGLSGYERQISRRDSRPALRRRVEIVRALINDPAVLLLDEPYRALDALTKSVMHEALLETYYRTGVTIFFITHDLEEAIFLGHRVSP